MANVAPSCCPDGVVGWGNPSAQVMFVGIAPGADEWRRTKRPLTGPSGRALDGVLETYGLHRDDVFCTNLICWWNDSPSKEEVAVCSSRLQQEIAIVNPKIIVPLGKLACENLLGIPFGKAQGAVIHHNNRIYLPTYHPAACLHRATTPREKEAQINAAYSLFRDISKLGPDNWERLTRVWPEITYDLIETEEQAQQLLDSLPRDQGVALDIETDYDKEWEKAHPFDSDILCIGVGWEEDHAYVIALPTRDWARLRWSTDVDYLYHNGPFDTQEIMRHTGCWLPIGRDTMTGHYCVDERSERGLHKLKHLAREWTGADFYEEDDHQVGPPGKVQMTPEEEATRESRLQALYGYNAKDVCHTKRLDNYLTSKRDANDERVYRELLLPASHVLREAQYRGIYIDKQRMNEIGIQFGTEFMQLGKKMEKWAAETLGMPDFNQRSPKQVKQMMELQGYTIPNTQKATLLDLLEEYPDIDFVPELLRYRTLSKLMSTYMNGVSRQLKYDGRFHPHFYLMGTVTGRLSYQLIQTLPKEKSVKDLQVVRSVFSATNDDYILLEADYSQIEGWIGAFLAEDDQLWQELSSGDWHSATATTMFGKTKEQSTPSEWNELRDAGKHINYGVFFNESAQGLTRRPPIGLGKPLSVCQEYLSLWRNTHPKFVQYQDEQMRLAREEPYILTDFGRKRRFPTLVNSHQLNQACNYRIQSTAGDYSLSSSIRLKPRLDPLDTHLLFIEHDALYYEVNKRYLEEVIQIIREEMQAPPLPGLPSVKIEIDLGPNLANLHKLEVPV